MVWLVVVLVRGMTRSLASVAPCDDRAGSVSTRLSRLDPVFEVEEDGSESNICSAQSGISMPHCRGRGWIS